MLHSCQSVFSNQESSRSISEFVWFHLRFVDTQNQRDTSTYLSTETSIAGHDNCPSAPSGCHSSNIKALFPFFVYPFEGKWITYFVGLLCILRSWKTTLSHFLFIYPNSKNKCSNTQVFPLWIAHPNKKEKTSTTLAHISRYSSLTTSKKKCSLLCWKLKHVSIMILEGVASVALTVDAKGFFFIYFRC